MAAKLHHFVPQFYLRQWCDSNDKLWIYPINGKPPFQAGPKNFAAETHLYRAPDGHADVRKDQEAWFSDIEGIFSSVWPDVIDRAESARTRRNISRFIATFAARHPSGKQTLININKSFIEAVKGLDDTDTVGVDLNSARYGMNVGDIREGAKDDKNAVSAAFLRALPSFAQELSEIFFKRRWGVVFSYTQNFITSDNPVSVMRGHSRKPTFGFGTPGTLINFPVSQNRFLVICDEWEHQYAHYKLAEESEFVERVVKSAFRHVFSRHPNNMVSDAISKFHSQAKMEGAQED